MPIHRILTILAATMTAFSVYAHKEVCEPLLGGPTEPNEVQRLLALSLELKKISPPSESKFHEGNPLPRLNELSEQNSNRLLESSLRSRYRLPSAVGKRIEQLSNDLDFFAVTNRASQFADRYYDNLLGSRHAVPFRVVVLKRGRPVEELAQSINMELISVKTSLLEKYGLVLPYFSTTYRLFKFFGNWQPEKVDDVVTANRYNLPIDVTDQISLRRYLTPDRLFQTFPDDKIRDRLAPLRESLHHYAMTFTDAEKTWRLVLQNFLMQMIRDGEYTIEDIEERWMEIGGPNRFMAQAQDWLGYEGLTVRIPLTVSPKDYYILRPYQQKVIGRTTTTIDHDSKPD